MLVWKAYIHIFAVTRFIKKSEIFNSNPYTLQIEIFTDDFETCSPLQSRAGVHKLCAIYFAIKKIPERYQSKVNYIQLFCFCYSDDINKSTQADFNNIWQIIVEKIKQLETRGVSVGSLTIKGTICWPSFDNLGTNTSLGYAGSFSARYFCRFCECDSVECGMLTEEIESKVRTKQNYESNLKTIETLEKFDYSKTFGASDIVFLMN